VQQSFAIITAYVIDDFTECIAIRIQNPVGLTEHGTIRVRLNLPTMHSIHG